MRKEERKQRIELTILVSVCIFIILFISIMVSSITGYFLLKSNLISPEIDGKISLFKVILIVAINSWIVGALLSYFLVKIPLKPINYFISQMNQLTKGNFKTRLERMPILPNHPTIVEVINCFNKLAEELENTEMLRNDFINNFSHEFKTPIVSIAGFAKLLKRNNLSEEQKKEYIDIIEVESLRLSAMATNVLNMTRVENQGILKNITQFNLSEQIRNSFLLLEPKWTKKEIDFNLDFSECMVEGEEDLLKQVWINLIDNAIKFTHEGGIIEIKIDESSTSYSVSILNTGSMITEEHRAKIFNKFYQVDQSHSTEGNGVGLAIVKTVVNLHNGSVDVNSKENTTIFTVTLPKKQI